MPTVEIDLRREQSHERVLDRRVAEMGGVSAGRVVRLEEDVRLHVASNRPRGQHDILGAPDVVEDVEHLPPVDVVDRRGHVQHNVVHQRRHELHEVEELLLRDGAVVPVAN